MYFREFYTAIVPTEIAAVNFLLQKEILTKVDKCNRCEGPTILTTKTSRGRENVVRRCKRKGCQTSISVRHGNSFFTYCDKNDRLHCNLTICEILELLYLWSMQMSNKNVEKHTGKSSSTVVDWFNFCREICTNMMSVNLRGQMIRSPTHPVQIDEARFAGRRKYNRGRLLAGDNAPAECNNEPVDNIRNHGNRIDGPWVFGLYKGRNIRYFYVERRDAATLIPIIQREVQPGSTIHSDEWPAYRRLNQIGFQHLTVNHQHEYVNNNSGAHTQGIERSWLDSKIEILKKKRGVPHAMLQGHLDEFCWRHSKDKNSDLFLELLSDIKTCFS